MLILQQRGSNEDPAKQESQGFPRFEPDDIFGHGYRTSPGCDGLVEFGGGVEGAERLTAAG
jgi:hypothetical protein